VHRKQGLEIRRDGGGRPLTGASARALVPGDARALSPADEHIGQGTQMGMGGVRGVVMEAPVKEAPVKADVQLQGCV
jgi:hypothetical protein